MASQVNLEKKRVAHVGNNKKSDEKEWSEDIVSDIIKSMESKIVFHKELENLREHHSLSSSTPDKAASQVKSTKKFLPPKKHPLMAKCHKNLKYLKHNRSIPKQRAHVAEMCIPKNIKKVNPTANSNTSKALDEIKKSQKQKAKITSKKVKTSMNKQVDPVSKDSSDSDYEFEKFIQVIQHESFNKRKKNKPKTTKCNKKSKSSDSSEIVATAPCVELENDFNKKKQKVAKCDKKKFRMNKKLVENKTFDKKSEESDFEMNESICFDSDSSETIEATPHLELDNNGKNSTCSNIQSNLSFNLTESETESNISKKNYLAITIERNPVVEKAYLSLSKETNKADATFSSKNQSEGNHDFNEKNVTCQFSLSRSISDEDECMIISEVPKSDITCTVDEKFSGPVSCKDNLCDTGTNKTTYNGSDFKEKSSEQSEDSADIEIIENLDDSSIKSNDECEIKILSVESLNSHLNDDCYIDMRINNERQEGIAVNENFRQAVQVSDQYNTNYFENTKKDFFKYAKTYSEPQNLIDNNSQVFLNDSKRTFMNGSEIKECLSKIDTNLINSALKQASFSAYFSNCDNNISDKNIPIVSSLESKHLNFNCDKNIKLSTNACVKNINPLPSHILEIAQKIDFKKILSLTKLNPNQIKEEKIDYSMASKKEECSPKKNLSHQSVISTNTSNSCVLPPNETNINQGKLALLHRFDNQSVESCSQMLNRNISMLADTFETKVKKYIESPSDELDVIAAANILDLNESKSKDFMPLFHLYFEELSKYQNIKSYEQNFSEGLKILEETQFEKLKYLEKAIQNVLKHDSCSLNFVDRAKLSKTHSSIRCNNLSLYKQETLNKCGEQSTSQNTISTNPQAEICNNCGLLAKLKCLGCEKVYFCSEKCGLEFWKAGHDKRCRKESSQVKMEKEYVK